MASLGNRRSGELLAQFAQKGARASQQLFDHVTLDREVFLTPNGISRHGLMMKNVPMHMTPLMTFPLTVTICPATSTEIPL
jgi:hypothetical protein